MQSEYNLFIFFYDKEGEICPAFPAGCRKGRVRIDQDGCPVCDSKGIFSEQCVHDLCQYQIFSGSVYIFLNCDFKKVRKLLINIYT